MPSSQKIIELYNRAVEMGHPDPERGVIGRAALTEFNSSFDSDGKVGIFGLSSTKASSIGWQNLESVEESFNAAVELDARSFEKHSDVNRMFMDSAGTKKDSYIRSLDQAYESVKGKISYEDGRIVDIDLSSEDVDNDTAEDVLDTSQSMYDVQEQVKREVANISATSAISALNESTDVSNEMNRLSSLLKEYIKARV